MREKKKKAILLAFIVAIPVIFLVNQLIISWIPTEYQNIDGTYNDKAAFWFASWSAPISMIIGFLASGLAYRIFLYRKSKDDDDQ